MTCVILEWPFSHGNLIAFTFDLDEDDVESQRCLLDVRPLIMDIVRPPVDCRICQDLSHIDRLSSVTTEVFETKYAYTGRPVVITDGMKNWTAVKTFSFEFFKSIYSPDSPVFEETEGGTNCQFFPYKTNFKNLSEVFQMSEERIRMKDGSEPWYIGWSNCDAAVANILRSHYTRPYFLPGSAESSRTDWIFMGSPGYGANLHIDNVNNPSWQAQVTGTKLWTLEPPAECYLVCPTILQVVVHPGEIIVLDTNRWFHSTQIIGSEMSITIGSEYD